VDFRKYYLKTNGHLLKSPFVANTPTVLVLECQGLAGLKRFQIFLLSGIAVAGPEGSLMAF